MIVKRIGVLTSGGDAPGMNAAIRAVVRAGIDYGLEVYAIHNGYLGLYEGDFERMYRKSVSEKLRLGGTFIGTARLKEFSDPKVREVAIENLKHYDIDALICLGGDGTYHGAQALYEMGIPTIGVPCTIDNDLAGTEFTIGFDTALNTAVDCVDKLRDTSTSHHRCSIIEVMGRNCGDLAIWTAIAVGAEFVICKETGFDMEELIDNINRAAETKNHAIIIVAENMVDVNMLAKEVSERTPFDARASILGHIQRGGSPSARDRVLASQMGVKAVEALMAGEGGVCVCIDKSMIVTKPFTEVFGENEMLIKDKYKVFKRLW